MPPMCGERNTFRIPRSGESTAIGSGLCASKQNHASSFAALAINAGTSTHPPRETFTKTAPGLSIANSFSAIMLRVFAVSGARQITTSQSITFSSEAKLTSRASANSRGANGS